MKAPDAESYRPTWAPATKDLVGTSLGSSRLWYTLAQGIVTEVYYPRIDIPQIRDLGFIVADDAGFWVELRKLGNYTLECANDCTPAVTLMHRHERFTFRLRVCPHQNRDVLLVDYELQSDDPSLRPYVLVATRLGADGDNNAGAATLHHGRRVL
ncbi:MAG: glycosyl hydrolase, partial [Gammaproteobacteria bacterium]